MKKLYMRVERSWCERLLTFPWRPMQRFKKVRNFKGEEQLEMAQRRAQRLARDAAFRQAALIEKGREMRQQRLEELLAEGDCRPHKSDFDDTLSLG